MKTDMDEKFATAEVHYAYPGSPFADRAMRPNGCYYVRFSNGAEVAYACEHDAIEDGQRWAADVTVMFGLPERLSGEDRARGVRHGLDSWRTFPILTTAWDRADRERTDGPGEID